MDVALMDVRFALRSLRKNLSVTVLVTLSLALAIAGNTIAFSFTNGILCRPMPYQEPEKLYLLGEQPLDRPVQNVAPASMAVFLDWQERQTSFSGLAAFRGGAAALEREGETPEQVAVASVSADFFRLSGVPAQIGRLFADGEDVAGRDKVLVVGHRYWQTHLGASSQALGSTLDLDGEDYTVVGVLPEDFEFLDPSIELWRPLVVDRGDLDRQRRDLLVLARLAPGVSDEQARAEMTSLEERIAAEHPDSNRGFGMSLVNLRRDIPDTTNRRLFALLQGALLSVLLIACANIANLMLARGRARERELAIRSSLGAGRGRIVRQLLTESVVMALVGGAAGLALSFAGVQLMASVLANRLPRFFLPVVDQRVLLFTLGVTVLAGLLFGLAPVLQSRRLDLVDALKDGSRGGGLGRRLLGRGLVVAEIALALVLLGGAGVLIRSFLDLQHRDPGFDTRNLLTFQVRLPASSYPEDADQARGAEALLARLETVPGVRSAAAGDQLPRSPFLAEENFALPGEDLGEGQSSPKTSWLVVSPSYFETVGMALEAGRLFAATDRADGLPVAVINHALAERYWGDEPVVGRQVELRGEVREIVGVVSDVQHGFFLNDGVPPTLYVPLAQHPIRALSFALRTGVEPHALTESVRTAVAEVDPRLALSQVQTLDEWVAQFFVGAQVFSVLLGGFGILALFLAAMGTYGVLAYSVAQRSHELGVRMAIGAQRGDIIRLVTRQGLQLAAVGLLLGIPGVLAVTRLISATMSTFVGIRPVTVVAVAGVLVVSTILASVLPARRAASVDPLEALRFE
ncbi:MAG: ABC transporter permease [Acidobacteria bacterium]|nr:ABC transporter permease [Acidobacteriota bacterium]